jgi:ABC-type transport system involved in cytochrome c biogenesis permease subunit
VTYAGYALLLVGFLWVLLCRCPKTTIAVVVVYAVIAILFTMRKEARAAEDFLLPVLRSPLIGWHVAAFIVGYTLLALMSLISVCALCVKRESALRRKLTEANRLLLYPSEMLLAIGIFVGAIWANLSWGRYWAWDPKEVWALITMLIYALAIHVQSLKWFRKPIHFHLFCVDAFLSVLMTYFGVNFVLGGLHSYA